MDLTFVLDFSTSVDTLSNIVLEMVRKLIHGLPIGMDRARVALVSYSGKATVNFYLNKYKTKMEILNALAFSRVGGKTNTQEALSLVTNEVYTSANGDRPGVKNVMILMSDGCSNVQRDNTLPNAEQARKSGIEIYAVGLADYDRMQVNGIASDPDSQYVIPVRSTNDVQSGVNSLLGRLC